jgi:hypothetical protein
MAGGIVLLATLGLSIAAFAGTSADDDTDGVYNVLDNCTSVKNGPPADCDRDNDGYGNECDGDFNQDNFTDATDFTGFWLPDATTGGGVDGGTGTDMNCDGYVDATDFSPPANPSNFIGWLGQASSATPQPGPSGLHCAGSVPCDL